MGSYCSQAGESIEMSEAKDIIIKHISRVQDYLLEFQTEPTRKLRKARDILRCIPRERIGEDKEF